MYRFPIPPFNSHLRFSSARRRSAESGAETQSASVPTGRMSSLSRKNADAWMSTPLSKLPTAGDTKAPLPQNEATKSCNRSRKDGFIEGFIREMDFLRPLRCLSLSSKRKACSVPQRQTEFGHPNKCDHEQAEK